MTSTSNSSQDGDMTRRYKIERVAEEYALAGIEDELVELSTRAEDSFSLRDLATYFNEEVLRAAMADADLNPLEGEAENTYRLLTEASVSSGVRTETRKKLERNGIDVDQLEADFVTYQAVRTYLRNARGVEYDRQTNEERIETVAESVARLENRTTTVTEEKLDQLRRTDRIALGEFRVLLDLRVFCEDCGTQYEVAELLDRGGCQCDDVPADRE